MINFLIYDAVPIFCDDNDFPVSITFDGKFFHILTSQNKIIKIDLASNVISKTSTNSYYATICYCDTLNVFLAISKNFPNAIFLLDKENFSVLSKIMIKYKFTNIYDICINKTENTINVCTDNSVLEVDFYGNVVNEVKNTKIQNLCACVNFYDKTIVTAKANLGIDLFLINEKKTSFKILGCLCEDFSIKSMTFYECEEKNGYIFCLVKYKNCSYKILKIQICVM